MAYTIRSLDGRTKIITATARQAASHAKLLQDAGTDFTVTDTSGYAVDLADLLKQLTIGETEIRPPGSGATTAPDS